MSPWGTAALGGRPRGLRGGREGHAGTEAEGPAVETPRFSNLGEV